MPEISGEDSLSLNSLAAANWLAMLLPACWLVGSSLPWFIAHFLTTIRRVVYVSNSNRSVTNMSQRNGFFSMQFTQATFFFWLLLRSTNKIWARRETKSIVPPFRRQLARVTRCLSTPAHAAHHVAGGACVSVITASASVLVVASLNHIDLYDFANNISTPTAYNSIFSFAQHLPAHLYVDNRLQRIAVSRASDRTLAQLFRQSCSRQSRHRSAMWLWQKLNRSSALSSEVTTPAQLRLGHSAALCISWLDEAIDRRAVALSFAFAHTGRGGFMWVTEIEFGWSISRWLRAHVQLKSVGGEFQRFIREIVTKLAQNGKYT